MVFITRVCGKVDLYTLLDLGLILEYIILHLSTISDVWRFPFTAYENGGGAFVIPYLCVLIFIGRPLYFLELSFGQFASKSSVKIWDLSPVFRGKHF